MNSKVYNLFTAVVAVSTLLILVPQNVLGQSIYSPPYLENVEGVSRSVSTSVLVTGEVVNTLPWGLKDVEVTVFFEEDPQQPYVSQTISYVGISDSVEFSIEKTSHLTLHTFKAFITNYTLQSEDVDRLLNLYHETQSIVLKAAIVQTFHTMSENAIPRLLKCIEVDSRSADVSLEQMHSDLMCLDGLSALSDPSTIPVMFDLLSWYDQKNAADLMPVKLEIVMEDYSPIVELESFRDFDFVNGSFNDLIAQTVQQVGSTGVPCLLQATDDENSTVREFATNILTDLGERSIEDLLDETDPEVLADIIAALGEVRYSEAVNPLLELAQEKIWLLNDVDASLTSMGEAGVPGLVSALSHPNGKIADHAERILQEEAHKVKSELEEELHNREEPVPSSAEPEDLVATLRDWADTQVGPKIDNEFEKAWLLFEAKDCEGAIETIQTIQSMFPHRETVSRHASKVAQVYQCQARKEAEASNYTQAISWALQAEQLDSDEPSIRSDLSNWFTIQGQHKYEAGDLQEASNEFLAALERNPDNASVLAALLEIAYEDPSLSTAIDQGISELPPECIGGLVSLLSHPNASIADHAQSLLRSKANEIGTTEFRQILRRCNYSLSINTDNATTIVLALRAQADAQVNAEIDLAFEDVWSLAQAGNCKESIETIETIRNKYVRRDVITRYAPLVAQAYHCRARELAKSINYSEAITLGLQAEQLDPDNPDIQNDVVDWYIARAKTEYNSKNWEKAIVNLKSALERRPDDNQAHLFFRRIVLKANSLYLTIGIVGLLVYIFFSSSLPGKES